MRRQEGCKMAVGHVSFVSSHQDGLKMDRHVITNMKNIKPIAIADDSRRQPLTDIKKRKRKSVEHLSSTGKGHFWLFTLLAAVVPLHRTLLSHQQLLSLYCWLFYLARRWLMFNAVETYYSRTIHSRAALALRIWEQEELCASLWPDDNSKAHHRCSWWTAATTLPSFGVSRTMSERWLIAAQRRRHAIMVIMSMATNPYARLPLLLLYSPGNENRVHLCLVTHEIIQVTSCKGIKSHFFIALLVFRTV